MKKILLVGFLLISGVAFSQVEKGDVNVTGTLSYINLDGEGLGIFQAKGGYFFSQNIEAGTALQLFFTGGETGVNFGPYATYNFLTQDARLLPYAGVQLSFFSIAGVNMNSGGIYGGAKYFITEAINVDGSMSLQQGFGDYDGTTFTFNVGLGFILGKLF